MSHRDYYEDLGLTQYATGSQIKSAYHNLAKKYHPDKSGDGEASAFVVVREAYERLSDIGFKVEYDREYRYRRMQFDTTALTGTRTAAYEAEEAARGAKNDRAAAAYHQRNPAYDQVQSSDSTFASSSAAFEAKAHGLVVKMTEHPAGTQRCMLRIPAWRTQTAGTDYCVFCLRAVEGGFRCPSCEALACKTCTSKVVDIERKDRFANLS